MYRKTIDTPIGKMELLSDGEFITGLGIPKKESLSAGPCSVLESAFEALKDYFNGASRSFDIPLKLNGTPFQKAVWNEISKIPYGETRTYGEIANKLSMPFGARCVGAACARNPVWIIIPCHRVIGKGNALTGFAGGIENKRFLLEFERKNTKSIIRKN